MFFQLLKLPLTRYIFFSGYIIVFVVSLINQLGLARSIWTAFSGGVAFLVIWIFIIRILMLLLSPHELNMIFRIKEEISSQNTYELDDESDELTVEDLYSTDNDTEDILSLDTNPSISDQETVFHELPETSIDDDLLTTTKSSIPTIGLDGKFDLTVKGKTLRTTPEDGAKATQKVLFDDENNNI